MILVNHIIKLANDLKQLTTNVSSPLNNNLTLFTVPKMIYEEIKDLKTRDFAPDIRYDFVITKEQIKRFAHSGSVSGEQYPEYRSVSDKLIICLNKYYTNLDSSEIRQFNFLQDNDLKNIVERDYFELSTILFPEKAWKSVVILCGSILEAILFDILSNENNINNTNNSEKAPKNRNNEIIQIQNEQKWTLQKLIEVAVDIEVLPEKRALSIDQVLRDYRNFVHPKKEIRAKHECTDAEAYMAKGSLDGVINHLEI